MTKSDIIDPVEGSTINRIDPGEITGRCNAVTPVLARVGEKWSMLIVMLLSDGPVRFNELKRRVDGISQRMLSLTLRGLERDGLVSRTVTPPVPPRVDYDLTDLGRSLQAPIHALGVWAHTHHGQIVAARQRFDMRTTTPDE